MITTRWCDECEVEHELPPYANYVIGVDLAHGGDCGAIVIGKVVSDGAGGTTFVVLDVRTTPPSD